MGRKKKQKWRNPTGRHNKIREKIRGHPAPVSIGYKKGKASRKKIVVVYNAKDLEKISKNETAMIGKIGKKKKIEIIKKAVEKKMHIRGTNLKKFARKMERKAKHASKAGEKGK